MTSTPMLRRVTAVLLLVIALIMLVFKLLPDFAVSSANFYGVFILVFAGIILLGAWLLWRGVGDADGLASDADDADDADDGAGPSRNDEAWQALEQRAADAEADAEAAKAKVAAQAAALTAANEQIGGVRDAVAQQRESIAQHSSDVATMKQRVAEQDEQLAARSHEIDALRAQLDEARNAASATAAAAASSAPSAQERADLSADGDASTSGWHTRTEFAGKTQSELNDLFGGGFVDGAMCRHFKIDYTDSKGQESEREVLVYAMVQRRGYINLDSFPRDAATCLTFRADRIRRLVDLQNGDEVSENIQEYLLDGRQMSDLMA